MEKLLKRLLELFDDRYQELNMYEEGQRDLLISIISKDEDAIKEIISEYE